MLCYSRQREGRLNSSGSSLSRVSSAGLFWSHCLRLRVSFERQWNKKRASVMIASPSALASSALGSTPFSISEVGSCVVARCAVYCCLAAVFQANIICQQLTLPTKLTTYDSVAVDVHFLYRRRAIGWPPRPPSSFRSRLQPDRTIASGNEW